MNRYLDYETNRAIEAKMLRFDDRELVGKVVANFIYGGIAGLSYTDGIWCAVKAELESCEEVDVHHVLQMDLYEIHGLGLISDEQFAAAREKQQDAERKRKQDKIKQLQAELGKKP